MGSRSESVSRWWAYRRALWQWSPGELVQLQKLGLINQKHKRSAVLAQEKTLAIIAALGGADNISEQELLLAQDIGRLELVLSVVTMRFLQGDGDPELASRVATLTSARRQNLQALGLQRREKEVSLHDYIAQRAAENASGGANGDDPDTESTVASDSATMDEGGGQGRSCSADSAPVLTDSSTERPSGADGGTSC